MLVIKPPVPTPDPARLRLLVSRLMALKAGLPRPEDVQELVTILEPWTRSYAGGIEEAAKRLRRLKVLGHAAYGPFGKGEVDSRISAAIDLLPPDQLNFRTS